MRLRSLVGLAALVFLVLAYVETDGHAQPGGFGGGGFDFKNPDSMFNAYAQRQGTKDSIEIDKVQSRMDPEMPAKMKAYAAKVGNTTGKMTKEQFADFWTKEALPQIEAKQKENKDKGGFGGFGGFGQKDSGGAGGFGQKDAAPGGPGGFGQRDSGGKGGFGGFGQKDAPAAPATPGGPTPPAGPGGFGKDKGGFGGPGGFGQKDGEKTAGTTGPKDGGNKGGPAGYEARAFNEEEARGEFKNMDRDSNGSLNAQEYDRSDIRRELDKYDVNKNTTVEIDEYVAYRKDRHTAREDERKAWAEFQASRNPMNPAATAPLVPTSPVPLEGDKPTLIRVDTLPKDLPAWFKELDTDKDAQVGLYEWRAGQKDNAEFPKYDRNEDGLITPEEVLWYDKNADRLAGITPTGPAAPAKDKATAEKDKGKTGIFGGMFGRDKGGRDANAKKDAPAKDAPAKDAPAPAKDAPAKDTPMKDAPQKGRRP